MRTADERSEENLKEWVRETLQEMERRGIVLLLKTANKTFIITRSLHLRTSPYEEPLPPGAWDDFFNTVKALAEVPRMLDHFREIIDIMIETDTLKYVAGHDEDDEDNDWEWEEIEDD